MIVEWFFGILKERWKILMKTINMPLEHVFEISKWKAWPRGEGFFIVCVWNSWLIGNCGGYYLYWIDFFHVDQMSYEVMNGWICWFLNFIHS